MSNTIWVDRDGAWIGSMSLANLVTGHFLAMLILSGSALARTDEEGKLIVFLDWHDQHWRGLGTVDLCLNAMPWKPEHFAGQVAFLERVIDGAQARIGWEKVLGWTPQVSVYDSLLERFRGLLRQLSVADLRPVADADWTPPGDPARCPVHDVLTYGFRDDGSCLICHI